MNTYTKKNLLMGVYIVLFICIISIPIGVRAQIDGDTTFDRQLQIGMTGEDVKLLQEFLAADKSIYPEGLVTGYFGSLTQNAVRVFQARHRIEQAGRVGPVTLRLINNLIASGVASVGNEPQGVVETIKLDQERNDAVITDFDTAGVPVLIRFTNMPGSAEQALVRGFGGTVRRTYRSLPVLAARVPEGALQGLVYNPKIAAVEVDRLVFLHNYELELSDTWGVERIGTGEAHQAGNVGAGVKVAIFDTGVDYTHPELSPLYAGGYDFVNNNTDPLDDHGHGTHVAGTIAAIRNSAGVVGTSPGVELYALKVLQSDGSGFWSDILAALEWAAENDIQVANHSYGGYTDPGSIVGTAFKNAEEAGIINIAAAGNAGTCVGDEDSISYPARYLSTVAVVATDKSDRRPCFSSTGAAAELAAPGVSINSTGKDGGYTEYSGTSMASPHVAGAAALVIGLGVLDENNNGRTNDEVRKILQTTADDLGESGLDIWYGFGLVNVKKATFRESLEESSEDDGVVEEDEEIIKEEETDISQPDEPKEEPKEEPKREISPPTKAPESPQPRVSPSLPVPALRHIPFTPKPFQR